MICIVRITVQRSAGTARIVILFMFGGDWISHNKKVLQKDSCLNTHSYLPGTGITGSVGPLIGRVADIYRAGIYNSGVARAAPSVLTHQDLN